MELVKAGNDSALSALSYCFSALGSEFSGLNARLLNPGCLSKPNTSAKTPEQFEENNGYSSGSYCGSNRSNPCPGGRYFDSAGASIVVLHRGHLLDRRWLERPIALRALNGSNQPLVRLTTGYRLSAIGGNAGAQTNETEKKEYGR